MTRRSASSLDGFLASYDRQRRAGADHHRAERLRQRRRRGRCRARFRRIACARTACRQAAIMIDLLPGSLGRRLGAGARRPTRRCGRRPTNAGAGRRTSCRTTSENKHYANFGCSYQNNLAAQIANPADLLGPRKQTPIDAENRGVVIDDYQTGRTSDDSGNPKSSRLLTAWRQWGKRDMSNLAYDSRARRRRRRRRATPRPCRRCGRCRASRSRRSARPKASPSRSSAPATTAAWPRRISRSTWAASRRRSSSTRRRRRPT